MATAATIPLLMKLVRVGYVGGRCCVGWVRSLLAPLATQNISKTVLCVLWWYIPCCTTCICL